MSDRLLALIIANNEYDDPKLARLVTPSRDAEALAEVLRDPVIGGFEVTTLVNETEQVVRREIARLYQQKKRGDLLLLYFSGHGVRDDRGDLYLAVRNSEPWLLSATAIPAAFITAAMDHSRSRRQVLILDCCHSGAFARGTKGGTPGTSVGTATAFEGNGYGRVVLTATDSTEYAWEGDQVIGEAGNSVFTHYLIQGLRTGEADADADGRITLDELYDYVYERVVNETPNQTPGKWTYKQQGEIVIARNPHPIVQPAELPPKLQQAVESPFAGVRTGAVSELERLLCGSDQGLALAAHEALVRLAEDDSRQVSAAATSVLDTSPLTVPAKPALVIERIEPEPKPEPRPQGRTATFLAWVQKQKNYVKNKMSGRWKWVWVAVFALIVIGSLVALTTRWTIIQEIVGPFIWTKTPTATITLTPTDIPTDAPTPTDTPTVMPKPIDTPTDTPTRTPTATPTHTPTPTTTPTNTSPAPTSTPTLPTDTPVPPTQPPQPPQPSPIPPPTNTPEKPTPPTPES